MDPLLLTTTVESLRVGVALLQQAMSGDADAESALRAWTAATTNYAAGMTAFNTARGPGETAATS